MLVINLSYRYQWEGWWFDNELSLQSNNGHGQKWRRNYALMGFINIMQANIPYLYCRFVDYVMGSNHMTLLASRCPRGTMYSKIVPIYCALLYRGVVTLQKVSLLFPQFDNALHLYSDISTTKSWSSTTWVVCDDSFNSSIESWTK